MKRTEKTFIRLRMGSRHETTMVGIYSLVSRQIDFICIYEFITGCTLETPDLIIPYLTLKESKQGQSSFLSHHPCNP